MDSISGNLSYIEMHTQSRWMLLRLPSCACKWVMPAFALCFLLLVCSALAQAPPQVAWKAERLSVLAERVPLAPIIREIASQTGMEVRGLERLHEVVSVRFSALPLCAGLRELLTSVNYVIVEQSTPCGKVPPILVLLAGRQDTLPPEAASTAERAERPERSFGDDLQSPDPNTRLARLQDLSNVDQAHRAQLLSAATEDADPSVRQLAYSHLFEMDNKNQVADILRQDAKNANSDIRKTAIESLGQLFTSDAVDILRDATEDANDDVRYTAFQQLAQVGADAGLQVLRDRLTHADPGIRLMALEAMASRGVESAREAALSMLSDSDERVRGKAEGLLYELDARKEE